VNLEIFALENCRIWCLSDRNLFLALNRFFFWNFFQIPPEFFKKMLAEFFQKFFPDLFGKNFEKPEENFFHIFRKILLLPLEAGKRPCLPLTS